MHTPLGHVIKSGTHPLRQEEGETATHNNKNYITMSLEDVGMQYSLAVTFHAFPVVRRQNMTVNSKDH